MKTIYCKKCGKQVSKNCKKGFCNGCRDRSGTNNPFYGKTHSPSTKNKLKKACKEASKKMWEDSAYREKVTVGVTGKIRTDTFKKEQSERIKKWFEKNPKQRQIRSKIMRKSWRDGKIEPIINSINESKLEKEIREKIKQLLPSNNVIKKTLKIKGKWVYPDIIVDERIIIEVYGNFWHGDPNLYKPTDIVHHSKTAKEIWEADEFRKKLLTESGYSVHIIWGSDYKKHGDEAIIKTLKQALLLS